MAQQFFVYYYATDPEIKSNSVALPPEDVVKENYSDLTLQSYPLYDNNFQEIGLLTRFITSIYSENIRDEFYQTYNYTIFLYDSKNTINFNFTFVSKNDGSNFFKAGVPINSIITSCSGTIYDKRGTVQILPFDNDVKSRLVTITIY
jgi:hypothetical protein